MDTYRGIGECPKVLIYRMPSGLHYYLCLHVSALGKMRELNYFLASKKQRVKLPRKYRQELSQIPELAEMSVEPNTSVKSEQEFSTHPKKQLECDILESVKDEEMESELDKLIKKDKSMKAPGKCPICDKVFVNFEEYMNHVWPLQFEEASRKVINWLEQIPELAVMPVE